MQQATKIKAKKFLNPEELLKAIPLLPEMAVADFGCGNGYYATAAGIMVGKKGEVYALDIMEDALSQTATLAKLTRVYNVSTQLCDLEKLGSCKLPDTSCDVVIAASILHQVENKDNLIREAYRVLKTGGKILVVEWQMDATFGPPLSERLEPKTVCSLLEKYSFRPVKELPAGSFHYALLYSK